MLTARERGRLRGLRVVPDEPGPEFQPGPKVPLLWRLNLVRLKELWKEHHERHPD